MSSKCSISMPNGVPQSPMWLWRSTRWPRKASVRVADDGAPEIADVHLFRDVRARVVDDDGLRMLGGGDGGARIGGELFDGAGEKAPAEGDVDEAGRRDG